MVDKKLTDNEIIKALEICSRGIMFSKHDCKKCPYYGELCCERKLKENALDLINRLQEKDKTRHKVFETKCEELEIAKAEIERLTIRLRKAEHQLDDLCKNYNVIKAEAYKECIEKINKNLNSRASFGSMAESAICESIISANDNLLKELVGEDNASKH